MQELARYGADVTVAYGDSDAVAMTTSDGILEVRINDNLAFTVYDLEENGALVRVALGNMPVPVGCGESIEYQSVMSGVLLTITGRMTGGFNHSARNPIWNTIN